MAKGTSNKQTKSNDSGLNFEAQRVGIIRAFLAWRVLKRAKARAPIPTGLHHSAQGCRVGEATLGNVVHYFLQPHRGCSNRSRVRGCNPFRIVEFSERFPRVAPRQSGSNQSWAERRSPVGAKRCRADLHPDLKADFAPVRKDLANPPFNMSDWGGENLRQDVRWKFGMPPELTRPKTG